MGSNEIALCKGVINWLTPKEKSLAWLPWLLSYFSSNLPELPRLREKGRAKENLYRCLKTVPVKLGYGKFKFHQSCGGVFLHQVKAVCGESLALPEQFWKWNLFSPPSGMWQSACLYEPPRRLYGLSSPSNIVQDLVYNNFISSGKTDLVGGSYYFKIISQSWVVKRSLFSQIH